MRSLLAIAGTTVALATVAFAPALAAAPSTAADVAHSTDSRAAVLVAVRAQAIDAARTASGRGVADPSMTNRFG